MHDAARECINHGGCFLQPLTGCMSPANQKHGPHPVKSCACSFCWPFRCGACISGAVSTQQVQEHLCSCDAGTAAPAAETPAPVSAPQAPTAAAGTSAVANADMLRMLREKVATQMKSRASPPPQVLQAIICPESPGSPQAGSVPVIWQCCIPCNQTRPAGQL